MLTMTKWVSNLHSYAINQSINLLTPKDPKAAIIAVHIKQNRQTETYRKTEMWRNIKYRYNRQSKNTADDNEILLSNTNEISRFNKTLKRPKLLKAVTLQSTSSFINNNNCYI